MSPIVLIHIVIIIVGLIFLGVILLSKKSEKNPTAQAKFTELIRLKEEELTKSNEEQIKIQQMLLQVVKANNTQVRNVQSKRSESSCVFYKCPVCGSIFFEKIEGWRDLIDIQAIYSDGEEVSDRNPLDPLKLTKCSKCGTVFSLNLLKKIEEISLNYLNGYDSDDFRISHLKNSLNSNIGEDEKKKIHNTLKIIDRCCESFKNEQIRCKYLDIDDLYKSLDSFPEEELVIRLRIWRKYNDYYRKDVISFRSNIDPFDSAEYQSNCKALLDLLDRGNIEEVLLLAEINRNLGNFEECLNLISNLEFEERGRFRQELKEILIRECTKGNRRTVRTDNYFAILKEQAEQAEKERINEEMKDPRWKVCPNNHCYENIRTECIWCGEKDVVDRLDKDVCLQHKDLYVGKQDGHDILTTDASIPMQGERIRKITVDYYQDKFIYFHIDGKDPNPFHINGGRFLTKCCEDIVAGLCESIDLSEQQEQLRQERRQERIKEIERKNGITACPVCGQQINDKEFSCCPICGQDLNKIVTKLQ